METITITTQNHETYSAVSNFFIDYYMTEANGEFVKVYLYLTRLLNSGRAVTVADIADHFNSTEKDICRAIRYWIKEGVLQLEYTKDKVLTGITMLPLTAKALNTGNSSLLSMLGVDDSDEHAATTEPEATKTSTVSETRDEHVVPEMVNHKPSYADDKETNDKVFANLLFQMKTYYQKPLTRADVDTLLYIYEDLSLHSDLIEYLFELCLEIGKMNRRYMQAVAVNWYQKGVTTVEQAKLLSSQYNAKYYPVLKRLNITDRPPTKSEKDYINTWYDTFAFGMDIINEACDRAMEARPRTANFKFVHSILENWHKQNVRRLSDIEVLDQQWAAEKKKKAVTKKTTTNQFNNFQNATDHTIVDEFEALLMQEMKE